MANVIMMKSVNSLLDECAFFIPSYQRGYRWEKQQIINLLDDINQFMNQKHDEGIYCLQPIVVRKTARENEGLTVFEVIDGQQRLTTIALILTYLNQEPFSLAYETRPNSAQFIQDIRQHVASNDVANNIDFYFFKQAFDTISEWFAQPRENRRTLPTKFLITLGEQVQIIWYEVTGQTEVREVFSRLNSGKIPLTNAELIKALILSKTPETQQFEFANEWDQIERRLRQERFWYFIHTSDPYSSRIELLFDIYTDNIKNKHQDQFYTFYRIQEETDFEALWLEIKEYLALFEEWYDNRTLYHYIGYLTQQRSIVDYLKLYKKDSILTKLDFLQALEKEVRGSIAGINIHELTYEPNMNNSKIKQVLLLFNIVTVLNQKNDEARFPFDRYKKERWTIEHIHAQNPIGLTKKELWVAWIQDTIYVLEQLNTLNSENKYDKLIVQLKEEKQDEGLNFERFEELFSKVAQETEEEFGMDVHGIENLVLLDQETNSALGNHFYSVKYERLINYDKQGSFIPICTRNAFMKYYSDQVDHFQLWSEQDRQGYMKAIEQSLAIFQ
ncbi:DUF262 domain-containing protein [Psychrobacillus sp. NPDC096389]|uniref:DUF262 domain-containing protein n=1 Tax=Psychrobacillus sp. NPDC096389 TaxID=3364490 RepID=UPI003809B6D9